MKEILIQEKVKHIWFDFIKKNNLKLENKIPYELHLENNIIKLILSFNKYFDEFNTYIIDKNRNEKHAIINVIFKKNLLGSKVLNDDELKYSDSLMSDLDKSIYSEMILLDRYCNDLLSGDFSSINDDSK
jgi:hypothetical protein